MNELKRSLANRFSELSYNPSAISIGSDGFVFRLNKNLVAKLFTGDQTTACHAACSQFAAAESCYNRGMAIPRPIALFPSIYPKKAPEDKSDLPHSELPSYTLVMQNINDGVEIPELDSWPERREHRCSIRSSNLSSEQLHFAEEMYWEQLEIAYKGGWVVSDSAPHWNVLWSPDKEGIFLIDQASWYRGTSRDLEEFRDRIDERFMPVSIIIEETEYEES